MVWYNYKTKSVKSKLIWIIIFIIIYLYSYSKYTGNFISYMYHFDINWRFHMGTSPWRVSNPLHGAIYVTLSSALTIRPPDRDTKIESILCRKFTTWIVGFIRKPNLNHPWSYDYPIANLIPSYKPSTNHERAWFSHLFNSFVYLWNIFLPRILKYSLLAPQSHGSLGVRVWSQSELLLYFTVQHSTFGSRVAQLESPQKTTCT